MTVPLFFKICHIMNIYHTMVLYKGLITKRFLNSGKYWIKNNILKSFELMFFNDVLFSTCTAA